MWDATRGTLITTLVHGGFLPQLDLGHAGLLVTAGWIGTGKLWRLDRGVRATTLVGLRGPSSIPLLPRFDTNQAHAIRLAGDGVEIWRLGDGSVRRLGGLATLTAVSFGLGGEPVVAGCADPACARPVVAAIDLGRGARPMTCPDARARSRGSSAPAGRCRPNGSS